MPALGESVGEGTVTRWLKREGDRVELDDPLLEVSTDKVDTEIPSPASGVLSKIFVAEDETVEVGTELAVIGSDDRDSGGADPAPVSATATDEKSAPAPAVAPERTQRPRPSSAPAAPTGSGAASPSAYVSPELRRLAAEHGVDLAMVAGTGVGGRIRKQDVLAAADQRSVPPPPAPAVAPASKKASDAAYPNPKPGGRTEKLSRLRSVIAARMIESLQVSAQLTTVVEADVTRIAILRERAKAAFESIHGARLSFLPFFAKAAVEALRLHPAVNASIDAAARTVTYHDGEDLGIAVDTDRGLLVPVVRSAGDLSLGGLARRIADLAERTRANTVAPDELTGGTFTLTNTGSRGALFDTPIINQPQVAILGTGAVVKRPVVVQDLELGEVVAIRSMVYMALTYDHRLVDGSDAARYLTAVRDRLEGGQFEADLGLT
jgi:2-oxoglutarate dehydrogenase E2 component (dihydrolipoamide succinyltransferase)